MWSVLLMAFQALVANKLRATLTILGTVIGVACVVALWNLGESGRSYMGGALASIGQNLIMVRAKFSSEDPDARRERFRPLREREYLAVRDHCPSVLAASPFTYGSAEAVFGNQRKRVDVRGCAPSFIGIRGWTVEQGAPFGEGELQSGRRVALVGSGVARHLFGSLDPLGLTVLLDRVPYRVVGVLRLKGSFFGEDQDNQVLVPYTTVADQAGWRSSFHMIWASARTRALMPQAKREIALAVREAQRLPTDAPDSVDMEDLGEVAASVDKVLVGFSLFLGAIGAISLLVGGIGIMNIMLVSVTERTREIGLRMALGATDFDILMQFLIEAMVLTGAGAVLGVLLGAAGAFAATRAFTVVTEEQWPTVIAPLSLAVALLLALAVGVFFGFYPAWRASRMHPIAALRHE